MSDDSLRQPSPLTDVPSIGANSTAAPVTPLRTAFDSQMPERQFQAEIVAYAKLKGWRTMHQYDSRRSDFGWPDLVLCRPPRLLFMEVKAAAGRVSAEQQGWLEALSGCGLLACVVRPKDWETVCEVLA